jgi:hypothetical protein
VSSVAGTAAGALGAAVTCTSGTRSGCGQSVVQFVADYLVSTLPGGAITVVVTHIALNLLGNFVQGLQDATVSVEAVWPNSPPGSTPNEEIGVGLGNDGGYTVVPGGSGQMDDAIRGYCADVGSQDWQTCG